MNRNIKTDSIILRSRRIGELHKGLSCLTRSHGIIDAIAYGAGKGKSKLAGLVDPFSLLYLYLYFDPVKDNYKISDIEQRTIFPNIRLELGKFYIASFWAELI
ncbi:MAG: recombination protein O N-terminal domain-containing protein [Spirochaetia bacterium]|jgi:DNA repair protein RecO (recombination protein O)|nr:recombination protein O N-terminal domain-containing protein [Spirochaetia bacterium]